MFISVIGTVLPNDINVYVDLDKVAFMKEVTKYTNVDYMLIEVRSEELESVKLLLEEYEYYIL